MVDERRRRIVDVALLVLLLLICAIASFASGVIWIADFDDSESTTGPAGAAALVLLVTFVGSLVTSAVRRSARAASFVVLAGLALAAVIWLGAL